MTTPKILSVIFSQDAAVTRGLRNDVRKCQGWDIRRSVARGLRSDTGQDIGRAASKNPAHGLTGIGEKLIAMPV